MAAYRPAELLIRLKDCIFDIKGMRWKYTYPPQIIDLLAKLFTDHGMRDLQTFWPIGVRPIDVSPENVLAPHTPHLRNFLSMVANSRPSKYFQSPNFQPNARMIRKARLRLHAIFDSHNDSDSALDAAMNLIREEPLVAYTERIPIRMGPARPPIEPSSPVEKGGKDDDDFLAAKVWWPLVVNLPEEWSSAEIFNTAVIDSGCYLDHPALLDDDGNRRVISDPNGYDTLYGHGTLVCTELIGRGDLGGTLANGLDNLAPGYSLLPKSRLRSFAVATPGGESWQVNLKAYDLVLQQIADPGMHECHPDLQLEDHPVKVVNLSIGSQTPISSIERETLQALVDASILPVACAHNTKIDLSDVSVWYPAALPTVVSVGAVSKSGLIAPYSRYGLPASEKQQFDHKPYSVDISAPGHKVYSLGLRKSDINGTEEFWAEVNEGTSFAAPFVSAAASVLWAQYPSYSVSEIRDILFSSVHWYKYSAQDSSNWHRYGRGILDCKGMIPPS